jgi:hypothetical protein
VNRPANLRRRTRENGLRPVRCGHYFDNDEVVAEYLSAAIEGPNPDVPLAARGDVAKARGMAQIAKEAGVLRPLKWPAAGRTLWQEKTHGECSFKGARRPDQGRAP